MVGRGRGGGVLKPMLKHLNFLGKTLGSHPRASIRRQTRSFVCFRTSILVQGRLETTPLEASRSLRRWL